MANFLDKNGVLYLWQKIVARFVAKEAGKGLSTNDFTTAEKEKLAGIAEKANNYTLPQASSTVLGGVKIGRGLSMEGDVLNATGGGIADAVEWSNVQNKPDTIAGYGITDAYTKGEVDGKLGSKADKSTTLAGYGITDAYTKGEVDGKLGSKADKSTTLAGYGITDAYTKGEVDGKLSSTYKPGGSLNFADLPIPSASNLGFVYNMNDAFTTDERFLNDEPAQYPIGTNVAVVAVEDGGSGTKYMFDVLAGFIDLSGFMKKTDMVPITNEEIDEIIGAA